MKTFTYSQYIKCIHTFRLNAVMQLAEEITEYKLESTKETYLQGKLLKNLLGNKKEAAEFINQFVEPRYKIKEEELVKYTSSSYLTKRYQAKEVDLVYQLKDKDIFYLLECQPTIDKKLNYRMMNYCLDIMREWSQEKKEKKVTNYPIIIPILIYTGKQKWNVTKNRKEKQLEDGTFETYQMNMEYNLIKIHKISNQMLLEQNTTLNYAMFLEKAESIEELVQNLKIIIKMTKDKRKLNEIVSMIRYQLNYALDKKEQQILLEEIKEKMEIVS